MRYAGLGGRNDSAKVVYAFGDACGGFYSPASLFPQWVLKTMTLLRSFAPYAHWLLRLALASVFLFHGIEKFFDLAGTAQMMDSMTMAVVAAVLETGGGALVLIGGTGNDLLTRLGGLLIAPVMLGAIVTVHWGQWRFAATETHPMGGMEFQVTLLMVALYFVFVGNTSSPAEASRQ
jgi:putative oxidoreductase